MDLGAALVALLIALVVKVAVLVLGARLLLRAYGVPRPRGSAMRLLPAEPSVQVRILRGSLALFYVAELTCGIEVYVLLRSNPWVSGIHGVTSALGMGLFALGLWLHLDERSLRFGQRRCALTGLCRGCAVARGQTCRMQRLGMLVGTFAALAALYPLFAPVDRLVADMSRYVLPFEGLNAWYDAVVVPWLAAHFPGHDPSGEAYHIHESTMVLELRVLPAVAFVVAVAAIVLFRFGRDRRAAGLLSFSVGFLAYSYFELVLYLTTDDVILGSLGHEVGELWFLLAASELLRVSFGPPDAVAQSASPSTG